MAGADSAPGSVEALGYAAIALASVLWSLNPAIISKFRSSLRPITFTGLRALIAAVALAPAVASGSPSLPRVSSEVLAATFLSAVLGPGLGDAAYTKAIQIVGGSLAVVVGYTYIFVAQGLAVSLLGEAFGLPLALGSALAFAGVVVATGDLRSSKLLAEGLAYSAVAALAWGLATVLVRILLESVDRLTLTFLRLLLTAAVLLPAGLLVENAPERVDLRSTLLAALITGVLGWSIGMYLFVYSIDTIGVSATVVATALTPVLSQVTTRLVARERVRLRNVLGALLVLSGVVLSALVS